MSILRRDRENPNQSYEQLKYAAAKARLPFDKDVWLNVAFFLDEQYVEWRDDIATLRIVPRDERTINTPRPVANKIMHFAAQSHATALQDKPTADVLPATDNPIDISDTSVGKACLDYTVQPQVANYDRELSDAVLWAVVGGEGFLKHIYNPRLKRPDILSCSPLDIYPDPYATKFSNCRYVIHSQFMDVEQVFDIWGKEVKPNEVSKADPVRSQLMQQMGSAPVLSGVVVNELWMKPCRRYPKGVYCVWTARERLVDPIDFPYDHGHLPFVQIGVIPRPGSLHYSSAVKYMRSGQMELNKYHAQKIMTREGFANPKWWIPQELELEHPPDDSPRQILTGQSNNGQLKPEIIQPQPMPDNGDGAWIVEELMHIVGLHEVSQAQVPGRVESSKAIALLKESDISRLSELNDTITAGISEGMWQVLQLFKQYVPEDTILQTYSSEGMPEVKRFKRDAIKEGMQVRVTRGTGLSTSRAARQDQLLLLWQNGIIRDPRVMAELMDLPMPSLLADDAFDIRLARNENLDLAEGTAIVPNSWDNHDLHLREHNAYRKTHEFLLLPTDSKQRFEHHCQTHDDLWTEQLGKDLQRQQMAAAIAQGGQGAPPPPGAGDQPPPQEDAANQDWTGRNLARAGRPVSQR